MRQFEKKKGIALILTFVILVGLSTLAFAFLTMISYEIKGSGAELRNMQAFYIAEAGRAKARWALTTGEQPLGWGEEDITFGEGAGEGTYTVETVDNEDGTCTITSYGYIPDDSNPIAKRTVVESDIEITVEEDNLSLGATASASSKQGAHVPANAIDADDVSKWKSNVNNGSWLKLDFGSSTTFDKVIYTGADIDSYVIKYSTDDVIYDSVTNPVESPAGTVVFDAVEACYLRFDVDGNKPSVNELETYNTDEGSVALGQGEFVTSW